MVICVLWPGQALELKLSVLFPPHKVQQTLQMFHIEGNNNVCTIVEEPVNMLPLPLQTRADGILPEIHWYLLLLP